MKTWNDYKEYVRTVDPETAKDIKETEEVAAIVTAMVEQRNALGLSQRELAAMCGLPQSSVARIESCKTTPNLGTLEYFPAPRINAYCFSRQSYRVISYHGVCFIQQAPFSLSVLTFPFIFSSEIITAFSPRHIIS